MIKLHMPFWQLLAHGAALYLIAVFAMRGRLLKRRLRAEMIVSKRATPGAVSASA
jgi:hypothetical protein